MFYAAMLLCCYERAEAVVNNSLRRSESEGIAEPFLQELVRSANHSAMWVTMVHAATPDH